MNSSVAFLFPHERRDLDMPDTITPSGADMVVYVADSQAEAYIVMGRLKNAGIPATVIYEPAGSAYGLTVGSLSGYRVMVRAQDYDEAEAILDEAPDDDEFDDDNEAFDDDTFDEGDDLLVDGYSEDDDDE